jgi:hypothetical protein
MLKPDMSALFLGMIPIVSEWLSPGRAVYQHVGTKVHATETDLSLLSGFL